MPQRKVGPPAPAALDCLVFAGAEDAQAKRVIQEVRHRNGTARLFDTNAFPEHLTAGIENSALRLGRAILHAPKHAYLRGLATHPLMAGSDEALQARPRGWIAQCDEKRALLESMILYLAQSGTRLINSLESNALHSRKPLQLALLHQAGIPVPRSLATNDPAQVKRFARQVKQVVYKPLAGGAMVQELAPEDLSEERLGALASAPVLFQERIAGRPIRAYVVGRSVVGAAEIGAAGLDYRSDPKALLTPVKLSEQERAAMIRTARVSGMIFAGIDFMRTEEGFCVLDVNPSPMFAVFEERSGIDVAGPLAAFMCGR